MPYNGRSSSGRYEGGGYSSSSSSSYQRRDSSGRRSGHGQQFGALDPLPSSRQSFGSPGRASVSPWASGQGPTRHSWGSGPDLGGRGRPDVFSPLGPVSAGGQSDTLNMATQLVSALLENQRQQRPQPFSPGPAPFGPPAGGAAPYGSRSGSGGYRSGRSSFDGGRADYGHRADYGSKYDRRGDGYVSSSRGRTTVRGRGATSRSRPYSRNTSSTGRTPSKPADRSATKKKEPAKKGVKTTQEALDEAKAAALEKETEAGDDKGEGAEGADLMSKDGADTAKDGDSKTDDAKPTDAKSTDADTKKTDKTDAKDSDAKKAKPAKPQREKILAEYLNCTVCNVLNMKSEQTFMEHTRGRRHMQMMELMDQRLEQTAKLIRLEVQVAARRAEQELQRRSGGKPLKESGFCGMCNIKVYKDIQDHRFNDPLHSKLKRFLHPRCCGMGFETPVMYERHLISFTHFRKTQQRNKDRAEAGTEATGVMGDANLGIAAALAAKQNGEPAAAEGAKEGAEGAAETTEGAPAAPEGAEGAAETTEGAEGEKAAEAEAATPAEEGQESAKEPEPAPKEPEKTIEDEEVPVLYDPEVSVATCAGKPFLGTYCTVCKLVTPNDFWPEHCRSRMHYSRFVVVRGALDRAKKEAADREERKLKAAAMAAAEEASEVKVVEDEAEMEEGEEGEEQRGKKRPAEDEEAGEAKKAATEEAPADESGLNKTLDETTEELDEKPVEGAGEEVAEGDAEEPEVGEETPAEEEAEEAPAEATTNGEEKPPAASPAKPAAVKPATPSRGNSRGRGGRFRGSPGRGGFARRRSRGGRGGPRF